MENDHKIKLATIANNLFGLIEPNSVILELGPFGGDLFTPHLNAISKNLILIEAAETQIPMLHELYPQATILFDDFHYAIQKLNRPIQNIVVFGVLYHCPGPIKLIEDIVNFLNPKLIFLESLIDRTEHLVVGCTEEIPNASGMRQVLNGTKSSGIVNSVCQNVIDICMGNLGYELVHEYHPKQDPSVSEIKIKESMIYTVWKNLND